jgi:phospholipid/cholesterol/gamma-HCH transport system substrate-binding protein
VEKRSKTSLRVGLFLNLGIGLLLLVLFLFGGPSHFFSGKRHYHFNADSGQGLIKGAKVLVAGVGAGTVSEIQVDHQTTKVRVDLEIDPKFFSSIREDSYVELASQGVLGDKVVMIQPGDPRHSELSDQAELPVRPSMSIDHLLAQGSVLLQHLDLLTVGLGQWVDGLGAKSHSKQAGKDAARILSNISEITGRLKQLDVGKLDGAMTSLNSILEKVDHGSGSIGALVNDPELYNSAKSLMGEANQNRIVRNLVRVSIKDADKKKTAEKEKADHPG